MNKSNRENIFMCLRSRITQYCKNIDKNLKNGNKEGAKTWIKQLGAIIGFVDGNKND